MDDLKLELLRAAANSFDVSTEGFSQEKMQAVAELEAVGYIVVRPTEPITFYIAETGRAAIALEEEVRYQHAQQEKEDSQKYKRDVRRSWLQVLVQILAPFVLGILTEYWVGIVDFLERLFR